MRLKKSEFPPSRREVYVYEGDEVNKRELIDLSVIWKP